MSFSSLMLTVSSSDCNTFADLSEETGCTLEKLPDDELISVCTGLGLDIESILMISDEEEGKEGEKESFTHDDYVKAAYVCKRMNEDLEKMLEEDPDALRKMEADMMREDPESMIEVITEVLKNDPNVIDELMKELEENDIETFTALKEELAEGETFHDRPELVTGLIIMMLAQEEEELNEMGSFDFEAEEDSETKEEL